MSSKFTEQMDLEFEDDRLRELSFTPFLPSNEVFLKNTNESSYKNEKGFRPIESLTQTHIKMCMLNQIKNQELSNYENDHINNYDLTDEKGAFGCLTEEENQNFNNFVNYNHQNNKSINSGYNNNNNNSINNNTHHNLNNRNLNNNNYTSNSNSNSNQKCLQINQSAFCDPEFINFLDQEIKENRSSSECANSLPLKMPEFEDLLVFGEQRNYDFCFENKVNKQNINKYSDIEIDDLLTDNYNNLSDMSIPMSNRSPTKPVIRNKNENTSKNKNMNNNMNLNINMNKTKTNTKAKNKNKKKKKKNKKKTKTKNNYDNDNTKRFVNPPSPKNSTNKPRIKNKNKGQNEKKKSDSFSKTTFKQKSLSKKNKKKTLLKEKYTKKSNPNKNERYYNYKKNRKKYFKDKKGIYIEDGWGQKTYQILPGDRYGLRILKKKRRRRKKRQNITKNAREILENWFKRHSNDQNGPYPDRNSRIRLGLQADTPELQVQRWFGQRRRIEKSRWENGKIEKPSWM
ncbi:broad-complex core protein isoform [Anaeramoeba flamelloides]|uniref:Broad-complex core protein isoform n=1 Tax=Anaeramoeba flamelloides TaxID=1746091 RepID=A0AAV7Z5A8_9EUKA|nr:broad-complex core protein isoform [Anaeramoeba flamelloides]